MQDLKMNPEEHLAIKCLTYELWGEIVLFSFLGIGNKSEHRSHHMCVELNSLPFLHSETQSQKLDCFDYLMMPF